MGSPEVQSPPSGIDHQASMVAGLFGHGSENVSPRESHSILIFIPWRDDSVMGTPRECDRTLGCHRLCHGMRPPNGLVFALFLTGGVAIVPARERGFHPVGTGVPDTGSRVALADRPGTPPCPREGSRTPLDERSPARKPRSMGGWRLPASASVGDSKTMP